MQSLSIITMGRDKGGLGILGGGRRFFFLLPLILLALALSSCGDSSGSTTTGSGDQPSDREVHELLTQTLLHPEDMPSGWEASQSTGASNAFRDPCNAEVNRDGRIDLRLVGYSRAQQGPSLVQGTGLYKEGTADDFMSSYKEALASCDEWESVSASGEILNQTISPIDVPQFGEETIAYRLEIRQVGSERTVAFDFVVIQRGDLITLFIYGGTSSIDSGQTIAFAEKAETRLESVSASLSE